MRKLTAVLAALGTIGTAGIAAVLFCVGVYAEGSRGGTWRIWTAADDREAGGGGAVMWFLVTLLAVSINAVLLLGMLAIAVWIILYLADM